MEMNSLESENILEGPGRVFRQWLAQKIEKNPSYSLRAMAKNLGVSPGFLSQVMNGKKKLSVTRAVQFSQVLKLEGDKVDDLIRSVALSAAKDKSTQLALKKLISSHKVSKKSPTFKVAELEKFKILSNWYHIAILELTETDGFQAQPVWISRRLKISAIQAREALVRLRELGLLVQKGKTWKKADSLLAFYSRESKAAVREYHKQMIEKAHTHLSDASPEAFRKRSITGLTMAIDPSRLEEAYSRIDQFRAEMQEYLSQDSRSEVYQLNVQLFNLSHESEALK